MRRRYIILTRILGSILLILLAGMFAVQNPRIQKAIADAILEKINSSFRGTLQVGEIKILPFSAFSVSDIVLIDKTPYTEDINHKGFPPVDTVARIKNITGTFTLTGLLRGKGIHLGNVYVDGAFLHLAIEPDGKGWHQANLKRIINHIRKDEPRTEGGNVFDIRKLTVRNARYKMQSFVSTKVHANKGVNYHDMDAVADLSASSIRFYKSRMHASLDWCTIREKNGCFIKNITGSCKVGMGQAIIRDFRMVDTWSDVKISEFTMTYNNPDGLANFIEKTRMEAFIQPSILGGRTVSALTDKMFKNDLIFNLKQGHLNGYVNDFRIDDLIFFEEKSGVSGTIDGHCLGLPELENMVLDANAEQMRFTIKGLGRFASAFSKKKDIDLSKWGGRKTYMSDIHISGPADIMTLEAKLRCGKEKLRLLGDLRNLIDKERKLEANFQLSTDNLELGTIVHNEKLGPASLFIKGYASPNGKESIVTIDSLGIERLNFKGHDYCKASAKGEYAKGNAVLKFASLDPDFNVAAELKSTLNRNNGNTHTVLNLTGTRINLEAMNVRKNKEKSVLSLEASADILQMKDGDLMGQADVHNAIAVTDRGEHNIGDITANIHLSDRQSRILLNSAPADIDFNGPRMPSRLVKDLKGKVMQGPADTTGMEGDGYRIDAKFHDTRDILAFLMPNLYIAAGTDVHIRYSDRLEASVTSERAAFKKNYIKGLDLNLKEDGGVLLAELKGNEVFAAGYTLQNFNTRAKTDSNKFEIGVEFVNDEKEETDCKLHLIGELSKNQDGKVMIRSECDSSRVRLKGYSWNILPFCLEYCNKAIRINDFCLDSDTGRLRLDGKWSQHAADTLGMSLENFKFGIIDELTDGKFCYGGFANARATLVSGPGGIGDCNLELRCDSLLVDGKPSGALTLDGGWDKNLKAFTAECRQTYNGKNPLKLDGTFAPKGKTVSAKLDLDSLDLAICAPFLKAFTEKLNGTISGTFLADGPLDKLSISSNGATLNNVELLLTGTGVNYIIDGPLRAEKDGLHLDAITIRDNENGRGQLSGSLVFNNINDYRLESSVNFDNLLFINNPSSTGKTLFGKVKASGECSLSGKLDKLAMKAKVTINEKGEIHVPLTNSLVSTKSDILTFTKAENETDPYDEMLDRMSTSDRKKNDMALNVDLSIGKDFQIYGDFDSSTGHCAMVQGEGRAVLDLRPSKDKFDVTGEYAISGGNYHFVLPGILDKNFNVNPGSEVKFNGNVKNSDLNIQAARTVKANLNTLVADTSAVATRRPVICGISITDKLKNPKIGFSINVPDLEPNIRSQVESALNTEAKVQKQFISLLLFGTFIPSEQSGVFNTSSVLYSNVTEVVSSQLSSILQKLDIPVDLGFGYQQNNGGGAGMFDVAVSTQLFNNRVIVGGSIGNKQYNKSGSTNTVVGDIDIEIKLDREGQFRLSLFSHSADVYTSYLDNSQRSGVGISYQKEYNKFGEFIKNIFRPSVKEAKSEETVTVNVPALSKGHR